MSKRVKKGKNAQKKTQRNKKVTGVRSSSVSVAQQRAMYEEEEPRAELGAGVRARAKGTTMPLGVRIMVGIMAFTMLTMMGVVSYSSLNDFDLIDWLTGEDVSPGTSSETNSASAMTKGQRRVIDATNKFDGFFVIDKDSGLTLTDVNSSLQTSDTIAATEKYKKEAEEKRDEILEADKKKIEALNKKKEAREEAKSNNPFKKFSDGTSQFRDAVVSLFTSTWDGLTGKNRAEEPVVTESELDDDGITTEAEDSGDAVDSGDEIAYNVESEGEDSPDEATEKDSDSASDSTDDDGESSPESLAETMNASKSKDSSEGKSLSKTLSDTTGVL